jgi:hypothetical protein
MDGRVTIREAVLLSMDIDDWRYRTPFNLTRYETRRDIAMRNETLARDEPETGPANEDNTWVDLWVFAAWMRTMAVEHPELRDTPTEFAKLADEHESASRQPTAKDEQKAASQEKPQGKQRFQEQEILRVIQEMKCDPKALPENESGKFGIKNQVRSQLKFSKDVFNKAWQRLLSRRREIAYKPNP